LLMHEPEKASIKMNTVNQQDKVFIQFMSAENSWQNKDPMTLVHVSQTIGER